MLRNALIPMVTNFLPLFPGTMTGSIFIEFVFGLPSLGTYFVMSSTNRDYPLVLGITVFWAVLISLTYLLTDILYGIIDRVRDQEEPMTVENHPQATPAARSSRDGTVQYAGLGRRMASASGATGWRCLGLPSRYW